MNQRTIDNATLHTSYENSTSPGFLVYSWAYLLLTYKVKNLVLKKYRVPKIERPIAPILLCDSVKQYY